MAGERDDDGSDDPVFMAVVSATAVEKEDDASALPPLALSFLRLLRGLNLRGRWSLVTGPSSDVTAGSRDR
jgi:hypothetical protein